MANELEEIARQYLEGGRTLVVDEGFHRGFTITAVRNEQLDAHEGNTLRKRITREEARALSNRGGCSNQDWLIAFLDKIGA